MIVYLAGPMTGMRVADAITWRDSATERLHDAGFKVLNPANVLHGLPPDTIITGKVERELTSFLRDKFEVGRCDIVLANLDLCATVSIGTVMEMAWAYDRGKFIVTVMPPCNPHSHPWLNFVSGAVVSHFEDAIDVIVKEFKC